MGKYDDMYRKKMVQLGAVKTVVCDEEECKKYSRMLQDGQSLPEGVVQSTENKNVFMHSGDYSLGELTHEDIEQYLNLKFFDNVATIKKCIVFFTCLTVAQLIITLILALA